MTHDHCDSQLKRLTVLKGLPEDVVEYFAALEDVPDEVFSKAVGHALKTRHWFPTPAELRADCDAVSVARALPPLEPKVENIAGEGRTVVLENPFGGKPLTIRLTRDWKFDCNECRDTGWRSRWCGTQRPVMFADVPVQACGKRREHDQHEWVDPCPCLNWNPTIRRRKEAGAKFSQSPEKVNS